MDVSEDSTNMLHIADTHENAISFTRNYQTFITSIGDLPKH